MTDVDGWRSRLMSAAVAADLHARLKLRIDTSEPAASRARRALLTVVEMHRPAGEPDLLHCARCFNSDGNVVLYPCREIRNVAEVMGVPLVDGVPPPLPGRP